MLLEPNSDDARTAKRRLAVAVVDSTLKVVDGLARVHRPGGRHVELVAALERLRDAADVAVSPGELVEPEFYEWYFRAVALVEARQFGELDRHVERLASVVALPLAKAQLLGEGLPLVNRARPSHYVGEREYAVTVDPLDTELVVTSAGDRLSLAGRQGTSVVAVDDVINDGRFALAGYRVALQQTGWARHREVTKYAEDQGRIHGDRFHFRLLSPDLFRREPERVGSYIAGLDRLAAAWPDLASEVDVLTDSVCAMVGLPFVGGSDLACFGTSFLYLQPEWSPLCYADHLAHEASHQRLHVELELAPAILNPTAPSDSPIRSDPRPLEGTMHATFVFMRLAQLFERAEATGTDDRAEAEVRLHRHLLGFYEGMAVLGRLADFTESGRALFEAMEGEVRRMRGALPTPDPRLYEQLNVDYMPPSMIRH